MIEFLKRLEAAARSRKADGPSRAMTTADADESDKVTRWVEQGQTFVQALASLAAEFRARAESAEQENQRLRERASRDGDLGAKPLACAGLATRTGSPGHIRTFPMELR